MRSTVNFIFLLFVAAVAYAGPTPSFVLADDPGWARDFPVINRSEPREPRSAPSSEWLLRDDQIRVDDPVVSYSRRVLRLNSIAGVQNWQEIEIDFDPTFQRLVLHHVRIRRANETTDALRPDEVRVIQRETDLAQRIYDGRMTALLFVHDLRPGDVIDYSWSLEGSNPILDGRFADLSMLSGGDPTALLHWRLLHESARPLQTKVYDSDAAIAKSELPDGWMEQRILLRSVPALTLEDQLPPWLNPIPRVQTSEFQSWQEVSRWASGLFADALEMDERSALESTVRLLHGRGNSAEERALAAVRFVQDEIRYLGIESGPNSHRPHPPSLVLSRRFGDCKDKALLLVQILRELGFDAHVALVDSGGGRELDSSLPSPFNFDHAIVAVRDGERKTWIDATVSGTGGTLWELAPPDLDAALVIDPETSALVELPDRARSSSTHVVEKWTLETGGSARFEVTSQYEGGDADDVRTYLAELSREELGEQYREYYAQADPEIATVSLPEVRDDRNENVIVVKESYRLERFWAAAERELWAHVIGTRLVAPSNPKRTLPLGLDGGSNVIHEIEIEGADGLSYSKFDRTIETDAFRLRARAWKDGDRFRFRWVWEPRQDSIPPSRLAQYSRAVNEADALLSVTVSRGALAIAGLGGVGPFVPRLLAGGAAAATGALLLAGALVGRRRKSKRVDEQAPRVGSVSDVGRLRQAIHCGLEGIVVAGTGQTVGQDSSGAPLVRIAVVCPRCHRSRPVTVAIQFGGSDPSENQRQAPDVETVG